MRDSKGGSKSDGVEVVSFECTVIVKISRVILPNENKEYLSSCRTFGCKYFHLSSISCVTTEIIALAESIESTNTVVHCHPQYSL